MDPKLLQTVLPILVIGVVFALRYRNLNKPRPFNVGRLWLAPAFIALVMGFFLISFPPSAIGWAIIGFAALIGAFAGLKRAQWMHLERDPQTGQLLMRQSPAALIFLVLIVMVRRGVSYEAGGSAGPDSTGQIPPEALLVTDGLMAFALAMVVLMRWTLWQRAKAVPPHLPDPQTETGT